MVKREDCGLRASVKSCRIKTIWRLNEEQSNTTIFEFRRDGACERRWNRDSRGLEWTTVYEYDNLGRLVITRPVGPHGWRDMLVYEYDADERISRVLARDAEARERVVETYSYHATGLKTHTRHVESETWANAFWGVEGTDAHFAARGAVAITTLFDAHNRPATALFLDGSGHIVNSVSLRYDDAGNLIEERSMREPKEASPWELPRLPGVSDQPMLRHFRYDERGRRIEMVIPHGPLGVHRSLTRYNEEGDESLKISYDEDRVYDLDEKGHMAKIPNRINVHQSWVRFRYQYDGHGNWIERVVEGRTDADKEWVVETIAYRTVTYFD